MFRLEIDTDNDAFNPWYSEVARLLRQLADTLDSDGGTEGSFRDINGNTVGIWSIDPIDTPDEEV
jgi:hypothetical protein